MTTSKDSKDILAAIYGISRGNPGRATKTVARILQQSSNVQLKEQVKKLVNVEDDSLEKMILNGIRSGLSHPTTTRGPRTIAAEAFVKNVCCAACFDLAKLDDHNNPISRTPVARILGTTRHQVDIAINQAKDLIASQSATVVLERKRRSDYIKDDLAPFVYNFLADDEYTRLDTRGSSTKVTQLSNHFLTQSQCINQLN